MDQNNLIWIFNHAFLPPRTVEKKMIGVHKGKTKMIDYLEGLRRNNQEYHRKYETYRITSGNQTNRGFTDEAYKQQLRWLFLEELQLAIDINLPFKNKISNSIFRKSGLTHLVEVWPQKIRQAKLKELKKEQDKRKIQNTSNISLAISETFPKISIPFFLYGHYNINYWTERNDLAKDIIDLLKVYDGYNDEEIRFLCGRQSFLSAKYLQSRNLGNIYDVLRNLGLPGSSKSLREIIIEILPYGSGAKRATSQELRDKIRDTGRDPETCAICNRPGVGGNTTIHHIRPWSLSQSDEPFNLIPLCPNAHAFVHYFIIHEDFKIVQTPSNLKQYEDFQTKLKTRKPCYPEK